MQGICGTPSCTNGIQDGDERRVDCGGRCGACLAIGQACRFDEECLSGLCFLTYHRDAGLHEPALTGICAASSSGDLALDRRDMTTAFDGFNAVTDDGAAGDAAAMDMASDQDAGAIGPDNGDLMARD